MWRKLELSKLLPVLFVVFIKINIICIFVLCHCVPLITVGLHGDFESNQAPDPSKFWRGLIELIVFSLLATMVLICYVLAIFTNPGQIPNTPEWVYPVVDRNAPAGATEDRGATDVRETKKTGEPRHCKWCSRYKPDRCHHCRRCRTCVLKMDHHCPWIYNCVGFGNVKYFWLLLLYSVVCLHFVSWAMFESVMKVDDPSIDFGDMFMILFGETLVGLLGIIMTAFWGFHIWLMSRSMTTIEFCEKTHKASSRSMYDKGLLGNMKEILGPNPMLWLLPCGPRIGEGITFVSENTRLSVDIDNGQKKKKGRRTK